MDSGTSFLKYGNFRLQGGRNVSITVYDRWKLEASSCGHLWWSAWPWHGLTWLDMAWPAGWSLRLGWSPWGRSAKTVEVPGSGPNSLQIQFRRFSKILCLYFHVFSFIFSEVNCASAKLESPRSCRWSFSLFLAELQVPKKHPPVHLRPISSAVQGKENI